MRKSGLMVLFLCAVLLLASCGVACGKTSDLSKTLSSDRTVNDIGAETEGSPDNESQHSVSTEEVEYRMEEVNIEHGKGSIYGRLYVPEEAASDSIVILSHGFGGSYRDTEDYAKNFAQNGITAFAYDFTGGGTGSRSGGSTTEMSVLTEADDLDTVIDHFQNNAGHVYDKIFLFGASQGGFVSSYAAGTRPDDIAGLIVLYPAYVLQDDSRERNPDPENGPETSSIMGISIGKIYDVDAQSFDIYDVMKNYTGKVLIIHGTADSIVPVSYSERAAETFPDAELVKIDGAGHGFYGSAEQEAADRSVQFVKEMTAGSGHGGNEESASSSDKSTADPETEELDLIIGDTPVQVRWENNESVNALRKLVNDKPLTIHMSMYGGFEQVGAIGTDLPRDDEETTTEAGDIVLYSGNQISVFYGSNSWAYTRLGKITDKTEQELADLLSNGDVTITITAG